ncbi:MAG: hypothetical protein AAB864_02065 [Patescibacteria group bacterium]
MSIEKPSGFGEPITDDEIDQLLGHVVPSDVAEKNELVEALRQRLDDTLSGVKLEGDVGSPEEQTVVTPDDIESHPDLVRLIQREIKHVDFVKNVFTAWGATLLRNPEGQWLVNRPGRDTALPLERILRALREEVLKPMVRAKRNKQRGPGEPPHVPIE